MNDCKRSGATSRNLFNPFAAGKNRWKFRFLPAVETLGDRINPAVTATFTPGTGTLSVFGDAAGTVLVNGGAVGQILPVTPGTERGQPGTGMMTGTNDATNQPTRGTGVTSPAPKMGTAGATMTPVGMTTPDKAKGKLAARLRRRQAALRARPARAARLRLLRMRVVGGPVKQVIGEGEVG
jgi:hypothetical protein